MDGDCDFYSKWAPVTQCTGFTYGREGGPMHRFPLVSEPPNTTTVIGRGSRRGSRRGSGAAAPPAAAALDAFPFAATAASEAQLWSFRSKRARRVVSPLWKTEAARLLDRRSLPARARAKSTS